MAISGIFPPSVKMKHKDPTVRGEPVCLFFHFLKPHLSVFILTADGRKEELHLESKGTGSVDTAAVTKQPPPGKDSVAPPSAAQAQREPSGLQKVLSGSESSAETPLSPGRPASAATAQKDGPSPTSPPQISDRPLVSPPSKETAPSIPPSKTPHLSPKHQENGSCTALPPAGLRHSTQDRHEHRTDPASSD